MIRAAAFGFVLTLSSALGQTHFVSLFNAGWRAEFALSHGEIGALYSAATLAAAFFLPWLGRLIDDFDLRAYAAAVIVGLALAALAISAATQWWHLPMAFFLLRLCGQGLSSHTALTATARFAGGRRGKALALSGLGFAAGEALAPPLIAGLLLVWTWREVWTAAAAWQIIFILAAAQWALRGLPTRFAHRRDADADDGHWTRAQVLRDSRFWRAAPALFAPSFIVTALLFHQSGLADHKAIDFRVWSSGLAAYSAAAVACSLGGGLLVDRFGGVAVAKFYLAPLTLAALTPIFFDFAALPFAYYALMGATVGLSLPAVNALWAEIYGVAHLGAVRALAQTMVALFSAAGPVIYGVILDSGAGWDFALWASAIWLCAAAALFAAAPMRKRPPPAEAKKAKTDDDGDFGIRNANRLE